jgi:Uncharacterized membrane protein (homolog of Drosophila rhomboid)
VAELAAGGSVNGVANWFFNHGALFASGVYTQGSIATLPAHASAPGYHVVGLAHGEWWRILTPAFLHYGPFHLAVNMYSLYFAGTLLEQVIGRWRFALLYFASGIAGSAGAIWLSPNSVTVGASGAIFGVLGGLFVLERQRHIATGGQGRGADRAEPDLHLRALEHLRRRPPRRPDRRCHPDVAPPAFQALGGVQHPLDRGRARRQLRRRVRACSRLQLTNHRH